MPEQAQRIAATLTLIKRGPEATEISFEDMNRGIVLTDYFSGEQIRIAKSPAIDPAIIDAEHLSDHLQRKSKGQTVSIRLIQQGYRQSAKEIRKRMSILEKEGHVVKIPGGAFIDGKKANEAWHVVER